MKYYLTQDEFSHWHAVTVSLAGMGQLQFSAILGLRSYRGEKGIYWAGPQANILDDCHLGTGGACLKFHTAELSTCKCIACQTPHNNEFLKHRLSCLSFLSSLFWIFKHFLHVSDLWSIVLRCVSCNSIASKLLTFEDNRGVIKKTVKIVTHRHCVMTNNVPWC